MVRICDQVAERVFLLNTSTLKTERNYINSHIANLIVTRPRTNVTIQR